MKYIRTKDELGIEKEDGTCCFRTWAANPNSLLKKDWLYADTIKELIDEFVVTADFYTKPHIFIGVNSLPIEIDLDNHTIYGAIWTDKGLIYVAKMNDKGELELL